MIPAGERWLWTRYADVRRRLARSGSTRSVVTSLGGCRRRDRAGWSRATADRHDAYRAAHPVPDGRVAIVCVSMRPANLELVIDNVLRQDHPGPELVFVANSNGFDRPSVEAALARVPNARIDVAPPHLTLGACLNRGMALTDARFVAKFDDDDRYGPRYLTDALRAFGYSGAGVVGKHTYYAHLVATDETVVRFPGHEFSYTSTLAGGTLVLDRDRVGDVSFPDRSLGEDRAFILGCLRRGIASFAADRFGYVQFRTGSNTWEATRDQFLTGTESIGRGLPLDVIER